MLYSIPPMSPRFLLLFAALAAAPTAAQTAAPDSLPPGVTPAMVERGLRVFGGAGICMACHGPQGRGTLTGPDLTDSLWLHSDGAYDAIVALIKTGVPAEQSKTGKVMPPKGGSAITEADLRAVAAYVWSLRHSPSVRRRSE